MAKIQRGINTEDKNLFQVCPTNKGYLSTEPSLKLQETIVKVDQRKRFPVLISNNSNKTYRIRKGNVIGKLEEILEENLVTTEKRVNIDKEDDVPINVPATFKNEVEDLIKSKDGHVRGCKLHVNNMDVIFPYK